MTRLALTGPCVLLAGLMLAPGVVAQPEQKPETSREPGDPLRLRASAASEPRDRSEPAQRRARARVGESEGQSPSDKEDKKPDDDVGFRWKGYPSLQLGKGTHVDFRARIQFDVRQDSPAGDADAAESDFARRRIGVEGQIRNLVAFEIDGELEGENGWRDVYANYQQFTYVQVQGGQFKLPFSLDENTSPTNLDFVYRSLAARVLAPGRDRGVMVHGRLLDRIVRYELGTFDQDGRNARTRNPERVSGGRTLAGRVVAAALQELEVDRRRISRPEWRSRRATSAGSPQPARPDDVRGDLLRSRSLGAGAPAAGRVRAALEAGTLLVQVGIHPRDDRASRPERRGHRPVAVARHRMVRQRHVGDYRREENRRAEQTAPAVHARRPRRI